jgi:hypothetical protein
MALMTLLDGSCHPITGVGNDKIYKIDIMNICCGSRGLLRNLMKVERFGIIST